MNEELNKCDYDKRIGGGLKQLQSLSLLSTVSTLHTFLMRCRTLAHSYLWAEIAPAWLEVRLPKVRPNNDAILVAGNESILGSDICPKVCSEPKVLNSKLTVL